MALNRLYLENFTVFEKLDLNFSKGINVLIGDNGTGKTHIMKLLYSACQAARAQETSISFPQKIVGVFKPDNMALHRLVKRRAGNANAVINVSSAECVLSLSFYSKYKKNINVTGERSWEKQLKNLISTFIPAKEILSHSRNLIQAIEKGNVDFDDTYKDIISAASVDVSRGPGREKEKRYLKILQSITSGTVTVANEKFYLKPGNQSKLEFPLVAEGVRKIALLWQLIKNGTLERGTVLFWDEPEANINPSNISTIAKILLALQSDGVQIFVATHDYFLPKYIEVYKNKSNDVMFHSLYFDESKNVQCESQPEFDLLQNNKIIAESIRLYKEEVKKVLE